MITGKDIIVFSDDWGRHPFSCQHIMKHFLPGNRLLWVQTIGMRKPKLNMNDLNRSIQKLKSFVTPPPQEKTSFPENLTVVNPFMLPFKNWFIRKMNRFSVIRKVRLAMKELDFKNPILITTLPNTADYLGAFGESLTVYYCVDEFSEWPGVYKKLVSRLEKRLLEKADLVVAVSEALARSKKPANGSKVEMLTHGVDIEHFNRAAVRTSNPKVLAAFEGIPQPVIGYFGLFDERSDQDIIVHMLEAHPDWSVVVIGNSRVGLDRLGVYPNFHHVGAVSYEALPDYVSMFSVCILPYVRSILTDNINPLKLKEYIATGKPVICTALPEAVKLMPWVRIAEDGPGFVLNIENILNKVEDAFAVPDDFLKAHTWEVKAECFSDYIAKVK